MSRYLFLMIFALVIVGCGSPDGNTWLIRTNTEELSVSEVGDTWNGLDNTARARFLSGDNPVGDFITALGRKTMVMQEIDNNTYLHSSRIQTMKNCWEINSCFLAYKDSLTSSITRSISTEDIDNYAELLGSIVWYTSASAGKKGPVRLPDLPWELAFAFDSVSIGSSVEFDGVAYTLDSITRAPEEMIAATIADSAQFTVFARGSLVQSRLNWELEGMKLEALETFTVDSAAVNAYCETRDSVADSVVLASWDGGVITAQDFDGIAAFLSLGQVNGSNSTPWVYHNLANQVRLVYIAELYTNRFPDAYQLIVQEAEDFATDQASELLFKANVTDAIVITDSMVTAEYNNLDSIPVLPESRVFESVLVPAEDLETAIQAMDDEATLLGLGYKGYDEFLSDTSDFVSRPVFQPELPHELDILVFLLDENNTEWQRPIEVTEGVFVFYKLAEVIPPHAASFEQIEPALRRNLLIHLEEQRTMEWMRELENSHQLQINNDILGDLPKDPGAWSEL